MSCSAFSASATTCASSFGFCFFFFFNDTATTEIYTLSLHDALPICKFGRKRPQHPPLRSPLLVCFRSEEHTSELQSLTNLVCRLLLEKKKKKHQYLRTNHPPTLSLPGAITSSLMTSACASARPPWLVVASLVFSFFFFFFFFKETGPPEISPFSPPRPFPI